MRDELLTLGRSARPWRLSVEQLRLRRDRTPGPGPLDPGSDCRYHAPEQARDALKIALLREADVPPAGIAPSLSAGPADRTRIPAAEPDRPAERISRVRARLDVPERPAAGGLPGYEVTWRREPERRPAAVRARSTPAGIADAVGDCAGRLCPCPAGRRARPCASARTVGSPRPTAACWAPSASAGRPGGARYARHT
ncbi:hypothetical protein [Streptomyces globosus]|uniref:hypothetical protein n=1 Tax=Streptomyces globosus TaxID=68209 RepID=UPI00362C3ED3